MYNIMNVGPSRYLFNFFCILVSFTVRIERLWRDVYAGVLDLFYTIFTNLENDGLLNPDDEVHLYALQRCFLPHVQKHLQYFQDGWNHHKLRTEGNQSPIQLWLSHQLQDPIQVFISELVSNYDT